MGESPLASMLRDLGCALGALTRSLALILLWELLWSLVYGACSGHCKRRVAAAGAGHGAGSGVSWPLGLCLAAACFSVRASRPCQLFRPIDQGRDRGAGRRKALRSTPVRRTFGFSRGINRLLLGLGFCSQQTLVWAAPPAAWPSAVSAVEGLAAGWPETLPPDPTRDVAASPQVLVPVSDAAELSGNERNRTFQIRFTQVFCPWYQPEIVPLVFRVPGTTVQEFLYEVAGGVSLTRLDFAKHAVPTVPQLFEDRASVVLGGNWHEAYGDAVLVLDFRALGGPVLARCLPVDGCRADLARIAGTLGYADYEVFLFGETRPLGLEARFRSLHGGVVQFCKPGSPPVWRGDLASRLHSPHAWATSIAVAPSVAPAMAFLGNGSVRTFRGGTPAAGAATSRLEAAADFVQRPVAEITCALPAQKVFHHLEVAGVPCNEVMAVFPAPGADVGERVCFVFLDARQLGLEPTFARLLSNVVDIGYLARQAGIFRVPPGFHLSLAQATPAGPENHITVQTGDVVTFGFRSDADSEIGDASSLGSQVVSTPDPDDSTADSHAAGSDVAPDTGTDRSSPRSADRRSRSRSPAPGAEPSDSLRPRQGRPTMWCLVSPWLVALAGANWLDGFVWTTTGPLRPSKVSQGRRMCKWCAGFCEDAALVWSPLCATSACLTVVLFSLVMRVRYFPCSVGASCGIPGFRSPKARAQRLDQEPVSYTEAARVRLDIARRFADERHLPWPTLPADDVFADQAARALGDPTGVGTDFGFGILAVGYLLEPVLVTLTAPATVQEALDAVTDARDPVLGQRLPHLVPVDPQPTNIYGLLLALPGWAEDECVACFDLTAVDDRLFVDCVPVIAGRDILLRLAGLEGNLVTDVYVGSSAAPMLPDEEVDLWLGVCLFFVPQVELAGPYFRLRETLLSATTWDAEPEFPMGPDLAMRCAVAEAGHRGVLVPEEGPTSGGGFLDRLSGLFGLAASTLVVQPAVPPVQDAVFRGVRCQGVYAVSGPEDLEVDSALDSLVLALVDCRPLLQGWHLLGTDQGLVDGPSLAYELSTFAPPGWEVHLDPLEALGSGFRVHSGQVLIATFVPQSSPRAVPPTLASAEVRVAHGLPATGDLVGRPEGTEDWDLPLDDSGALSSRERSRSPRRLAEPVAAPGGVAAGGATFFLLAPDYAPERVVLQLEPVMSLRQCLRRLQSQRESLPRLRFPYVFPASPQPSLEFAVCLAVPAWDETRYIVLDCLRWNGTVACERAPDPVTREQLMAIAGIPAMASTEVYVPRVPVPLSIGQEVSLDAGSCVTFLPHPGPYFVAAELVDMLQDLDVWSPSPPLPCSPGLWVHVLSDTGHYRMLVPPDRRQDLRADVASQLGFAESDFVLQLAVPDITDSYDRGVLAQQVMVATRMPRLQLGVREEEQVPAVLYFLDLRPIASGISWAWAEGGSVSVAALLRHSAEFCPQGFHPIVTGGVPVPASDGHALQVHSGEVLTVDFFEVAPPPEVLPDDFGFSEQSPGSSGGPRADPGSTACGHASAESQPGDARTSVDHPVAPQGGDRVAVPLCVAGRPSAIWVRSLD